MNGTMGSSSQDQLLMEYLMQIGALQPQQADIGRQRAMVEQLRGASQVPTDVRQAGRVATARHPLEMLAPAIGQGVASYREQQANTAQDALQRQRQQVMQNIFSRFGGGGVPQQTAGMFPQRPMPGEDMPTTY